MNQDCPFCTITKEEPPSHKASAGQSRILKEGTYMFVIFSNPRLMPGHLLVIPKRHVTRLSEMTEPEKKELLDFLIEFEEKILAKLSAGCDIRQNYKPYAESSRTSVRHFHFHLQPRNLNDELHQIIDPHHKPLFRDLPEEERDRLFKLFTE